MNSNAYIALLGRQPMLGVAELERRFGSNAVTPLGESAALVRSDTPVNINDLGGSIKIAQLVEQTNSNGWLGVSKQAVKYLERELASVSGKITLGVSAYGFDVTAREVQKTGLIIKTRLKNRDGSIRLIPSTEPALSSAQTYHNKLAHGGTKREIILVNGSDGHGYIGEVTGVQDIDAYTLRDRGRPKRDALNGMLPPKLAQIMINLAVGNPSKQPLVFDPFCGTGVVLQEALLMSYAASGSDLNPKMPAYTRENLTWLHDKIGTAPATSVVQADATSFQWREAKTFTAITSETYLGEPMAQQPDAVKLEKVMARCEDVIRGFLVNIETQLAPGTPLCVAIPAWRIGDEIKHLRVVDDLKELGYNWIDFEHVDRSDLLYFREDQVVARELLVLIKS